MKRFGPIVFASLIAFATSALSVANAAKKKPEPKNVIDTIIEMNKPEQKRGADGQPAVAPGEEDPAAEDAPYKGCVDAWGVPVIWKESPKIADLAQAVFDKNNRPIVEYNPARFRFMSEITRLFFYAHECGHHVLGHLYGGTQGYDKEQQADCWAIMTLKESGALGEEGLQAIQQDLGNIGRQDEHHTTGLRRAGNLKWCLTEPIPVANKTGPKPPPPPPPKKP